MYLCHASSSNFPLDQHILSALCITVSPNSHSQSAIFALHYVIYNIYFSNGKSSGFVSLKSEIGGQVARLSAALKSLESRCKCQRQVCNCSWPGKIAIAKWFVAWVRGWGRLRALKEKGCYKKWYMRIGLKIEETCLPFQTSTFFNWNTWLTLKLSPTILFLASAPLGGTCLDLLAAICHAMPFSLRLEQLRQLALAFG